MTAPPRPSPRILSLSFEVTAGAMLAHRAPFDPGRLVFSLCLRGVRVPFLASGLGGTVVDRDSSCILDRGRTQGGYRPGPAVLDRIRDMTLPLDAYDELALRLRATGLPERVPDVSARVDTSDGWVAHRLSLVWDELPPVQLIAHAMSSGYVGPDAPAVVALFDHLVTLGRGAAAR